MKRDLDDIRQRLDAIDGAPMPATDFAPIALRYLQHNELPSDLHQRRHALLFLLGGLARASRLPAPTACTAADLQRAFGAAESAGHCGAATDFLGAEPSSPSDPMPPAWRAIAARAADQLDATTAAILQRAQQLDDGTPPPSPVWL